MGKATENIASVVIKTIGCRTNQEEMVALRLKLEQIGYAVVDQIHDADIAIVNTCSVTAGTESKTKRLLAAISRDAPDIKIMVTGCFAQQDPHDLKETLSVHWVVGNTYKDQIAEILTHHDGGVFHGPPDAASELKIDVTLPLSRDSKSRFRTRFPLKIQEGCDFHCAYCIVPSLRGPSRSALLADIVECGRKAVDAGYKELVLTGTHIGQFGKRNESDFIELLEKLLKIEGEFRIRFSSLDPRDLSDELLKLMNSEPRICDHLHISVQSFDEDVLFGMGRPYADIDALLEKMISFRTANPKAGLGADFIVGFPAETDKNFCRTLDRVQRVGFSYAHIFRFSARPGTAASALSGQISEKVKTARSDILRDVIALSRKQFIKSIQHVPLRIVVESESPVRGLTSNFIHVEIPGLRKMRNSWLDVAIVSDTADRYFPAESLI